MYSVDHHRSLKMGWLPAFYRESLAGYWAGMKLGAERLAVQLTAAAKAHKEVDLWAVLGRMTMEVTAITAFGCAPCCLYHKRGCSMLCDGCGATETCTHMHIHTHCNVQPVSPVAVRPGCVLCC